MKRPPLITWCSAACVPLAVALALGWFWGPPLLLSDTATGLVAWRNWTEGGALNTLALPNPSNIALTIEEAVTWWSPGQYIPLGMLLSAGFPFETAVLLPAAATALSFVAGLVKLSQALGALDIASPWIALGASGSWHPLYAFRMFTGGEIALIAFWPWVALAGWRLRERPLYSILFLPPLFLLGSIAKHAFAIYALGSLTFLWLEAARGSARSIRAFIRASWPWVAVCLLYLSYRLMMFPLDSPYPSSTGQVERSFTAAFGFGSFAPVFSATGLGSLIGRVFFAAVLTFEQGWNRLALPLAIFAAIPLGAYAWLATRPAHWSALLGSPRLLLSSCSSP